MKVSDNLKSDNTNLHSFFINDLENAKNADSETLNKYLLGAENEKIKNRIVLDSKKDKEKIIIQMLFMKFCNLRIIH